MKKISSALTLLFTGGVLFLGAALGLCVTPFIPFDLGKIVIAIGLGSLLRHRLAQAGFYKEKRVAR